MPPERALPPTGTRRSGIFVRPWPAASRPRAPILPRWAWRARAPTAPGGGRDAALAAFDRAQELLLQRTPQAAKEAASLLRQGAEKGDLLAAYNLAYCYDKGVGLPADLRLAYVWYGRAARSPVETVRTAAQAGMVSIAVRLAPEQLAEAQAMLSAGGRAQ